MPLLTQAEKAQISVNKTQLLGINPSQGRIQVRSNNPVLELIAEQGGSAAAYQVINGDTSHLVMDISWSPNNEDMLFSLFDKTSGALNAQMELRPDGKLYIGNIENADQNDLGQTTNFLLGKIIEKADKTSLPTIYSGDTIPLDSLGKDLDWYHHYESGTTIVEEIIHGTSLENYSDHGFYLAKNTNPVPASGVHTIEFFPLQGRMVYIDLTHDKTLATEELTLIIGNDSVVLEELSNAAGSYSGFYPTSADATIQGITDTTQYVLQAKVGSTSSKEVDYEKHNGIWERIDFLNIDEINELIRSYDVTIEMNTAHNSPSQAECINAFDQLPHADYTKDDSFHIMSTNKDRMNFVKYLANGSTDVDNYTTGLFFTQELSLAT